MVSADHVTGGIRAGPTVATSRSTAMPTTSLPTRISRGLEPFFRRDPFRALQQEMDEMLSRFSYDWNGGELLTQAAAPSLDLSETDNALEIRMDLPGIKPEEVDIEISGNTVRISGERKEEKEEKGKAFHRIERMSGTFSRTVTLPCGIKEDKVTAECHDGVLTVTLPKTEEAKTHKIKVNGK
jgi:HSP20 family protein